MTARAGTVPGGQGVNIRGIGNSEQTAPELRIVITACGAPIVCEAYPIAAFPGEPEFFKHIGVLREPAPGTPHGSGAIGQRGSPCRRRGGGGYGSADIRTNDDTVTLKYRCEFPGNQRFARQRKASELLDDMRGRFGATARDRTTGAVLRDRPAETPALHRLPERAGPQSRVAGGAVIG